MATQRILNPEEVGSIPMPPTSIVLPFTGIVQRKDSGL